MLRTRPSPATVPLPIPLGENQHDYAASSPLIRSQFTTRMPTPQPPEPRSRAPTSLMRQRCQSQSTLDSIQLRFYHRSVTLAAGDLALCRWLLRPRIAQPSSRAQTPHGPGLQ